MIIDRHKYDNAFAPTNVYGQVLALLTRYAGQGRGGLHIDIGCGYGRIAEELESRLSLTYIGLDVDVISIENLKHRGFEAHQFDLAQLDSASSILASIIGERQVASISIIDVLEHIEDASPILDVIHGIAKGTNAPLIISVPNVCHRDIGIKLAFGRWDYTQAGLLEHDHIRFYSEAYLTTVARASGWFEVGRSDTSRAATEQTFPATHPALSNGTPLREMLLSLRSQADHTGEIFQFVRAYLPGQAAMDEKLYACVPVSKHNSFLSIVIRTQGRRPDTLRDALLALASQSNTNFEVIIIAHRVTTTEQISVEMIIEQLPSWLNAKVKLHLLDRGGRAAPLNFGFSLATGDYISILDDDDIPLGHWVETFQTLSEKHPGRILRAAAVRQDAKRVKTQAGELAAQFISGPVPYAATYNWIEHLLENHTPSMSVAYPRGAFHDLGFRFDESLTTTEDWDFTTRVSTICGVASAPEVTSIYRWWVDEESSRTSHNQEEWLRNRQRILAKVDSMPCILPATSLGDVRRLYEWAKDQNALIAANLITSVPDEQVVQLRNRLQKLLKSTSWKMSSPLRSLQRLFGRRKPKFNLRDTTPEGLRIQINHVYESLSWRVTRPIRSITGGRSYER